MRARLFLIVLCLAAAGCAGPLAAADATPTLRRGVNILGYDPLWRAPDKARFQEKHFQLLHQAGFDFVRINLHPFQHMGTNGVIAPAWFGTLDWAMRNARSNQLAVILDLHEFQAMGENPAKHRDQFLAFWKQMASRYQDAPPTVLFEILNEPNKQLTPELWNQYLAEALRLIRATNPRRTVVVGPASWNSIDQLPKLRLPPEDRNLLVTVHYYQPMEFTHQGAAWTGQQDKTGIAWEGTPAERGRLERDFARAADWARAQERPLLLGEFGAYDKGAMDARARYTAAVARAAEARGWSWAYWQFDSDFILFDMRSGSWVEPILNALIPKRQR